jgi:hypothetical protein
LLGTSRQFFFSFVVVVVVRRPRISVVVVIIPIAVARGQQGFTPPPKNAFSVETERQSWPCLQKCVECSKVLLIGKYH